jgi:hypothetical protein
MSIAEGLIAGITAGAFMGAASWTGHRLGWFKSNLLSIDGQFAARLLRLKTTPLIVYALGIPIHLATSAIFGIIYAGIVRLLDVSADSVAVIAPYVAILWLGMLLSALPVAGVGLLGRKLGQYVWAEQLTVHAVFGAVFWWALTWL